MPIGAEVYDLCIAHYTPIPYYAPGWKGARVDPWPYYLAIHGLLKAVPIGYLPWYTELEWTHGHTYLAIQGLAKAVPIGYLSWYKELAWTHGHLAIHDLAKAVP
jgi:hypothetical protein